MKAFLLAAGQGTRLRPLTDAIPKCLAPIQGTPILKIWLEICRRYGIDEVLINLHAHGDTVRKFVEHNGGSVKLHISEECDLLGSAGTLRANRAWIQGEESFWVFYADVLTSANLKSMQQYHLASGMLATLGVYRVPDPSRCGIALTDEHGLIREFVEKPKNPTSNLAFAGLMLAGPTVLDSIPDEIPADIGFHLLPRLVNRMAAYPISEFLLDIGTMENYKLAQTTWPGIEA